MIFSYSYIKICFRASNIDYNSSLSPTSYLHHTHSYGQFKSKLLRPATLLAILYIIHPAHLPVFNTYNSRPFLASTFCFSSLESCRTKLFSSYEKGSILSFQSSLLPVTVYVIGFRIIKSLCFPFRIY